MKSRLYYEAALGEVLHAIASGTPYYDLDDLASFASGLAEDVEEPLSDPMFAAEQDAAQQLDEDIRAVYKDRGKARQIGHTLRIHLRELFSTGDASSETVANGVSIGLGFALESMPGAQAASPLIAALVSTVSGEVAGRGGDAATSKAKSLRKRAVRDDNFREVMQGLDTALSEAASSLGSSTWHYRRALEIREWLTKEYKTKALATHWDEFGPKNQRRFQTQKGAEKEAEKEEAHYAYKLCSYLHHEEKMRLNLLPILGAFMAIQNRVRVWRYFWEDSYIEAEDKPLLSDYASILDKVERTDHRYCDKERLCYERYVPLLEPDPFAPTERVNPLSKWTREFHKDMGIAKEKIRGTKEKSKKQQKHADSDRASLLDHAVDNEPVDYLDGTPDPRGEQKVQAEADEPEPSDNVIRAALESATFPWQAGLVLTAPHEHTPEEWRKKKKEMPTGAHDWYAQADAVKRQHPRTEGWCRACRRDMSWFLFQAYCEVAGKTWGERFKRKAKRKFKNADKKQMAITIAAVAVGVGVSVGTFGLATPIGIGAGLGVSVTAKTASQVERLARLRKLVAENEAQASRGQSSSGGSRDKGDIKLDHEMIRNFSVKVRRHFKACEEAFRRMRVLVRESQDDFGSASGQMATCLEAAQYVWAAQKFRHHYEKLMLYTLPFELYATSLLATLGEWEREWTPGTDEYKEARYDEPGGVTFAHYIDLLLRHHVCECDLPSHATPGTSLTMRPRGNDVDPIVTWLDGLRAEEEKVLYV